MAEAAQRLIVESEDLCITSVSLAEAGYVLRSVYGIDRAVVMDLLSALLVDDGISVLDIPTELAIQALAMARDSGRVSLADGLIWAAARANSPSGVFSFDRKFPNEGIDLRIPV